jgi:hypothetical protein
MRRSQAGVPINNVRACVLIHRIRGVLTGFLYEPFSLLAGLEKMHPFL